MSRSGHVSRRISSGPLRILGFLCLGLAVIMGMLLAGIAVQGLRLARDVRQLRVDVAQAQQKLRSNAGAGPVQAAAGLHAVARIQSDTHRMRALTGSTAWRAGSYLPGLSPSVKSITSLVQGVDDVALQVAPALASTAVSFSSAKRAGPLDLRPVTRNRSVLHGAATELDRVVATIRRDNMSNPTVRHAHEEILGRLTGLQALLRPLVILADVGGPMTGEQGPRRYLLALQTPAESRATGGLVGSFLELQVDHGRVSVVRSGTNRELDERATRDVTTVDGGFSATWGPYGAQRRWYSSNLSLDFPSVSAVWAALYERQYAVKLDGLVGVTPEALTSILPHTGPIPLPEGGTLDGQNAARFLEAGLYAKFPLSADEGRRNAYQLQVLQALVSRLFQSQAATTGLVRAVGEDVANGSLRLASTHPQEQAVLAGTAVAGALPATRAPFIAWSSQNIAGNKLDVYVHRALAYQRRAYGDHELVVARITLRNDAPLRGLPEYVTVRSDLPAAQRGRTAPGSDRLLVTTYLSAGARITSATVDGRPVPVRIGSEKGHPLVIVDLILPPHGGTARVVVTGEEPLQDGPVMTLRQPAANPDTMEYVR